MAENIPNGYIEITDRNTPINIVEANIIQVPQTEATNRTIVYISKHGNPDLKENSWITFYDGDKIMLPPPYFIMCNKKIKLPAMSV